MRTVLAILMTLALGGVCVAADCPDQCGDVPECPIKGSEKRCCDCKTKLVWERDGCKAETWSILSGDPATAGPFVIRFRWSEAILVPPHVHAVDEHVTVIEGASRWGMGKDADPAVTWRMTPGMSSTLPKMMPHYAFVDEPGSEIQIQGYGPFETYWVDKPCEPDPAMSSAPNSPRKSKPASKP